MVDFFEALFDLSTLILFSKVHLSQEKYGSKSWNF